MRNYFSQVSSEKVQSLRGKGFYKGDGRWLIKCKLAEKNGPRLRPRACDGAVGLWFCRAKVLGLGTNLI